MAASKQGRLYVNTVQHCSPTSVGLAQACPKNLLEANLSGAPYETNLLNFNHMMTDQLKPAQKTIQSLRQTKIHVNLFAE